MRILVVSSCIFLMFSGVILAFPDLFPWTAKSSATSILHIWVGFFFLVIFPMYSWDHIKSHEEYIQDKSWVTMSGVAQLLTGIGLIISGIPLLLYGENALETPRILHLVLTLVLFGTLIIHKFSSKTRILKND